MIGRFFLYIGTCGACTVEIRVFYIEDFNAHVPEVQNKNVIEFLDRLQHQISRSVPTLMLQMWEV